MQDADVSKYETSTLESDSAHKENQSEVWEHTNTDCWTVKSQMAWVYLWKNMHGIKKQTIINSPNFDWVSADYYWQTCTQSSPSP